MCKILIFGGTTEGRLLAEFCVGNGISVFLSVATDYGASVIEKSDSLHILQGRMNSEDIAEFISGNGIEKVFDATHPYAVDATKNIMLACRNTGAEYLRIKRENSEKAISGKYFDDIKSLLEYLNVTEGGILVTTGSKELKSFCSVSDFKERCAVRVLPSSGIVDECIKLGFLSERIIAEKGPFSEDQNIEHLRKFNIKYMVTKESGAVGGFENKVSAAEKCGVELLIIKRPLENGITVEKAEKILLTESLNA